MERYWAESRLKQAQRRIDEIEGHIADLRRVIAHKRTLAQDPAELERLLEVFEHSLQLARERLEIERQLADVWQDLALWRPRRRRGDQHR